jgi:rifampin ADP-ribosylating transferase
LFRGHWRIFLSDSIGKPVEFPGNPTRSYRTRTPLRVTGEISDWQGHAPEQLQAMKDGLARLAAQGIEAINE